jgi:isopentenyl diphosphate isomerase/L-lactate dehydrogenase-like FMN-dependent dehydrogenase
VTSPCSVAAYKTAARRRLPRAIFDYLEGGAESELTLARNAAAFAGLGLRARLREESGSVDPSCRLLGASSAIPLVLAPTGGLKLFWPEGEVAVARAAADFGVVMAVSAGASTSLEAVAAAAPGPKWFQLCIYRDWDLVLALIDRARHAGYGGMCITIDGGLVGKRERDIRNRLGYSPAFVRRNLFDLLAHPRWSLRALSSLPLGMPNFADQAGTGDLAAYLSGLTDPCPNWQQVARIRRQWTGPLILKGVMVEGDAARAVDEGMDAIVVSNHGGRQFDSGLPTLVALPAIARRVDGRIPVLVDGGISRGIDILKAIALGASACMIGRAHLWGLALRGEQGVRDILQILRDEIVTAMAFCGVDRIDQIGPGDAINLEGGVP